MVNVELDGVERAFTNGSAQTLVLRGVNLSIAQGDFLAIEGPSGGGKSTLLNVIGTLDTPTGGSYRINGMNTADASASAIAKLRSNTFAFVFQNFHLLDRRLAVDSVELGLLYRGIGRRERRELALAAMTELGIDAQAYVRSNRLSGGERQRVALARAIASGASVVIADEPTGNLDSANAEIVVGILRRLNAQGKTVILVTHSPEVASAGRRRVIMRGGMVSEPEQSLEVSCSTQLHPERTIGRASRLRLRDLIADAFANILSRPGRVAGLIAAVALGVALTIGTMGISESARAQVTDRFNAHTSRDVTAQWAPGQLDVQPALMRTSIAKRLEQLKGVAAAAIVNDAGETSLQTGAERPSFTTNGFSGTDRTVAAGRISVAWAPGHEARLKRGEALIGKTLASQSGLASVGTEPMVFINQQPMKVVGLISKSPRLPELLGGVLVSEEDANSLSVPTKSTALILTTAGAAQQVARQAPLVIDPYQPTSLSVSAPSDPRTLRSEVETDVNATLIGLTALALLASVAGLANAMVLAVIERKQEFGLRRAIGARRHHIFGLVLAESVSIGLLGGFAGLLLGLGGILTVTISQHWMPVFDPVLAPVAVLGGIVVGAIGGLLAAVRAARIQAGEALRL